ncbi:MAG: PIN domain-containing protein [Roseofilum sp. Belize BBD 4]|uniref:type II toxin-antitoxin system VapC family toxin n=1 Tax=Roseofilum sp. Belize BBD 4 TaxID=2821500 RepID=UPI001B2B0C70|nr:PIN domain-containing protein [Roseofilum sp. Belize BBD 4]MBP0035896.1 PIN domain-containing protein [Roseofilum sp. Belize BBD 4]
MRILLDTNIVIDVALQREPFFEQSDRILASCEERALSGYVSASTISDIFYIVRKARGKAWTIEFLSKLLDFCAVAVVDSEIIHQALKSDFQDFEDAIQYQAALRAGLDGIVTRNPDDFRGVTLSIFTPTALLRLLNLD